MQAESNIRPAKIRIQSVSQFAEADYKENSFQGRYLTVLLWENICKLHILKSIKETSRGCSVFSVCPGGFVEG